MKKEVIQVRYRNSDGTLSRPHKIQKLTLSEDNIEYRKFNNQFITTDLTIFEVVPIITLEEGKVISRVSKEGNRTYSKDYLGLTENINKYKLRIKKTKDEKSEVIRVKFITIEELGGEKHYSRPTRVVKHTRLVKYSVKEEDLHVEKEKEESYYTKQNSKIILDPNTFITKWAYGPTPTPKPTYEKRGWRSKDVKILHSHIGLTYRKCRELLEENGSLSSVIKLPEAVALFEKKQKNKGIHKHFPKQKQKRGNRDSFREKLNKLRMEHIAAIKLYGPIT
jgi:hypothetical protein